MKNVNLSDIIGDNCAISFALAFRSMYCTELIPQEGQAKKLISTYLKEYEHEISVYFDENGLDDYCFVTDTLLRKKEVIDEKFNEMFNSGIYNLGMILSFIDDCIEIDSDLLYANSLGDYSEGDLFLAKKMDMLPMIHMGISSYLIEYNQINRQFNWNKHYNVVPDMQYIIKNQRKYQCCKDYLVQNNPAILSIGDCFLSDILLLIDLYRVKQQCTLEKFMVSLLFIMKSPEYDEWMQQYAYTIISILNDIMFCGEIHRLYLQDGYYNTMSDSEKTSIDATTRMSVIFSASNDDIYILRVDLPHKGENSFHINMEEVVGEAILPTGYPMTYEEFNKLKPECNKKIFDDLFFVLDGRIWFRSKFGTILKHENITSGLRDGFKELFHQQAHISIMIKEQEKNICEGQIAFVDEVKRYLKRLSVPESFYLSFGKDDIAYSREIKKVRGIFQAEKFLLNLIIEKNDRRVMAKEVLSLFEKYMDVDIGIGKKSKVSSIVEVWEILEELMISK